jgi:hypothetical protein
MTVFLQHLENNGSSVSVVTRLGAGILSPRYRVQIGFGANPANNPVDTWGFFNGSKADGAWSWPLTKVRYWCLFWAASIQSIPCSSKLRFNIILVSITRIYQVFPLKYLYVFLICLMRATCRAHLVLPHLIALRLLGAEKKLRMSSLCLTKHHAMKTYWESGCIVPRILWLRH